MNFHIICGYFFFFHFVSCLHRNYILRFLLVFCFWFRGCWIVVLFCLGLVGEGEIGEEFVFCFCFGVQSLCIQTLFGFGRKFGFVSTFVYLFLFFFSKGREINFSMLTINVFFFWGLFISIIGRQVFLLITFSVVIKPVFMVCI